MNALIKKEIRLILPAWIAAMPLAIVPIWIIRGNAAGYFFLLGTIFLGLASFGQELAFRTFPMMLSQPVSRNRIWLVKISVLAIAFITVLFCGFFSWIFSRATFGSDSIFENFIVILLGAFIFYSGGLWTTLLLRQTTGAFWFTLLIPATIVVTIAELNERYQWSDKKTSVFAGAIFATYSVAGFFWAWKMFLNAQDTQWSGGEISFSWRRKISDSAIVYSRPRHWLSALIRKEIQLHQVSIAIAALILFLHLASVIFRKLHPNFENSNVKFILEQVWALWLLMPLLIGSTAVAEERRLGIVESQFSLPVTRRAQLFFKFFVALILSLVLGAMMPVLINHQWQDFSALIGFSIIATTTFFISFYASSLARTTLQAIGLAIVTACVIYFYMVMEAIGVWKFGHYPSHEVMGIQILKIYLGFPILILTLLGLIIWNFKWLHQNWKLWRQNLFIVASAFATIFVLTHAIYFRAWELFTSNDFPHGIARLDNSSPPKLLISFNAISTLLPDGRLWTERPELYSSSYSEEILSADKAHFVDDSNWIDAASDSYRIVAIKSDGTLWSFQTSGGWHGMQPYPLTQIGFDNDWSRVADGFSFLLLKKDGTLWTWGVSGGEMDSSKLKKYLALPPQRLGEDAHWTNVFRDQYFGVIAQKNDGSLWRLDYDMKTRSSFFMTSFPQPLLKLHQEFTSFASSGMWDARIKTNGQLWLFRNVENEKPIGMQIGQNAKWKAVGGVSFNSIIAIRDDGTLWKWSPESSFLFPHHLKPTQLGNQSDWIALCSLRDGNSVAVAADGGLWIWDEPSKDVWLAPSRKPIFIGNIFQGANSDAK